jgi:hypothetical protein
MMIEPRSASGGVVGVLKKQTNTVTKRGVIVGYYRKKRAIRKKKNRRVRTKGNQR